MGGKLTKFLYEFSSDGADIADYVPSSLYPDVLEDKIIGGKKSGFAIQFASADFFAGKITIGDNGLPENIGINGVKTIELVEEFKKNGLKVCGIGAQSSSPVAGRPGMVTLFFEGDPKEIEAKFNKLMENSVKEMKSQKNINSYEQELISSVRSAYEKNEQKSNFFGNENLSEGERKNLDKLITELSKAGVDLKGSISKEDLMKLSNNTGISQDILEQAAIQKK